MSSYVDTTVTLTSASLTYQYQFPTSKKTHLVWVGVSNQSQGPLTLTTYSDRGAGGPPVNIDPGQPFVSQLEFYLLHITGIAGQVFNVKIQDEQLDVGKRQIVSQSGDAAIGGQAAIPASSTNIFYTVPPGIKSQIVRILILGVAGQTYTLQTDTPVIGATDLWGGVQTFPASGQVYYSTGSWANFPFTSAYLLMPGESLQMINKSAVDPLDVYYVIWESPL
jgi:hypothetical protein